MFSLLLAHPAGGVVGSFGGIGEIPVLVIFPGIAVPDPHDEKEQHGQQPDTDKYPVDPVWRMHRRTEAGGQAGGCGQGGSAVPRIAAPLFPEGVVADELPQVAARIQDGKDGNGGSHQPYYFKK